MIRSRRADSTGELLGRELLPDLVARNPPETNYESDLTRSLLKYLSVRAWAAWRIDLGLGIGRPALERIKGILVVSCRGGFFGVRSEDIVVIAILFGGRLTCCWLVSRFRRVASIP